MQDLSFFAKYISLFLKSHAHKNSFLLFAKLSLFFNHLPDRPLRTKKKNENSFACAIWCLGKIIKSELVVFEVGGGFCFISTNEGCAYIFLKMGTGVVSDVPSTTKILIGRLWGGCVGFSFRSIKLWKSKL